MSNSAPTNEQYIGGNIASSDTKDNVLETSKTILENEYMSSGLLGSSEDTIRLLMHNYDAWSGQLTDAQIDDMLRDPEVYKCFTVIKNGVLGDGVTFSPAIAEPTPISKPPEGEVEPPERIKERLARDQEIERFQLSKKYADFATRAFDNLEVPLRDVLDDMLGALPYGNRVAEKIFEEKKDREFGTKLLYLKRLNVKPRESTIFAVDKYYNLVGFKVYFKSTDKEGNPTYKEKIIRKEKFVVLSFGGKDNDPRGTSFLQSTYLSWQLKMELWPEYLRWLVYSAVPPIVGYTSPEVDSRKVLRDSNGNIVTDSDGNTVFESDVGALLKALKEVRNASAIALPYGAKVETLNGSVSGDPFKGFRDVLNEEIEMGLILQTLATSDSRHNTRAASQTHISILDDLIWRVKGTVRDKLTEIVKHLMVINFENFDETLTPIVSLGDTARREFAGDVGAISQLHISGFIGESQKVGIDNLLGLPKRDVYSDREYEKQKALEKVKLEAKLQEVTSQQAAANAPQDSKPVNTTSPPPEKKKATNGDTK